MKRTWVVLMPLAVMTAGLGLAEDDEPGRGVARISLINGDVSVRRGDSGDWVAAAVNAPLVVEDHVLTGPNSRAEIQFDWANMVRLAANTEIRIAELEQRRYQVQLSRGTASLRVLRDSNADVEINTPSVSIRPDHRGAYRITVNDDGQSEITVRSGEAEVYTPSGVERLKSGRTMQVRGTPSNPEFQLVRAIDRDEWDRWNEKRDEYLERSRSYQYVSRDIYGAEDLDSYGRWVYAAPYGWAWSPYGVGPGWAPYRYGRWSWIDWYGWSWVSYDPWGWAPYHYGRWFNYAPYGWCWYPGPIYHRHFWRPALVGFFGVGSLHVGFGFGHIGWVPLAPYEPFYPWYGRHYYGGFRNRTFIDNSVRIVNNVTITNVYRNARVSDGVSGVASGDFVRGGRPGSIRLSDPQFRQASLVQGQVPVAPGRESVRFSDRQVASNANLPRADNTRFFSRRPAAAVDRVPFEDQRRGMERVVGRTFGTPGQGESGTSVRAGGGGTPSPGAIPGRTESGNLPRTATDRASGDWRRVGESPRAESGNVPRTESGNIPRTESRGGWRRVGEPAAETGNLPRTTADRASGSEWRRIGGTPRTESEERNWRRFGEPVNRGESVPGNLPRASERSSEQPSVRSGESGNWRRFEGGERSLPRTDRSERSAPQSVERPRDPGEGNIRRAPENPDRGQGSVRQRSNDDRWQRFSTGSPSRVESRPAEPDRSGSQRWSSPRSDRGAWAQPRSEAPSQRWETPRSERQSAPVQINPPIVRERPSSPRFENRGGFGGGGSFGGGMPRSGGGEMRSAPSRSAPSGGESRGSGGGGGMSRSGGGGSVRGGGRGR